VTNRPHKVTGTQICGTGRNGEISVHYTSGFATASFLGGAASLPAHGAFWLAARLLLDGAGALFGLYLVITLGLLCASYVMRSGRDVAPHGPGTGP